MLKPILLLSLTWLMSGCASDNSGTAAGEERSIGPAPLLYVWAGDLDQNPDHTDFLAVLDTDPNSSSYGEVLGSEPVGAVGTNPHHTEPLVPMGTALFANGFDAGRTFLFDLSEPERPNLSGELDPVPGLEFPHSFIRLDDGELIATMQYGDGSIPGNPGGLARFDSEANLVAVASAADPAFEGELIRPYSVEIIPDMDRAVTTSRTMNIFTEQAADVVQIWGLSDLALLHTMRVPRVEPVNAPECIFGVGEICEAGQYSAEDQPFESRLMDDGSVLMNTLMCGIYRVTEIDTDAPGIELVLNFPDLFGCSVPTVIDHFLVLPVMFSETILVLDISEPGEIREVSRFDTPGYQPHWAVTDPGGSRIVVTSSGTAPTYTVLMLEFDPRDGQLRLDEAFGAAEFPKAGVSFYRDSWPHGETGTAIPHAAVFGYR